MINDRKLKKRHHSEMSFHDRKAKWLKKESFYTHGAVQDTYNKMLRIAGNLKDKKVLDFGCGTGWSTLNYAQQSALVIGLDISRGALERGRDLVERENLQDRIFFVQGSGEYLPFRGTFDMIIGIAILHHLDLNLAVKSLKNALNENGRAIFMEPLNHNPAIKLFRILTPGRRTKDEKPLDMDFISSLSDDFSEVVIYGYDLLGLFAFCFVPFKAFKLFRTFHLFLTRLDEIILEKFPGLQKYCWGAIVIVKK